MTTTINAELAETAEEDQRGLRRDRARDGSARRSSIDLSHPARSQQFENLTRTELGAGRQPHDDVSFEWTVDISRRNRGRWEGITLVVETTNFNGKTAATNPGTSGSPMDNNVPTSESLRIVERFARRRRHDQLRSDDRGSAGLHATVEGRVFALPNFIKGSQFERAQKPKQ